MGKSAGGNVATSTTSYPSFQQPALKQFVDESTRLYQQGGPQLSPEPRVADFNQDELSAQKQLGAAVTPAQYLAELGTKSAEFNLGAGRDPATNPYLQNAISAAVAPIGDQLLTRALPAILTAPGQITGAVGAQIRAQEEAQRNENANRYEYEQRLPYENLLNYGNLIRQPFGAEAVSEVKVPQPSTASAIIGAGLSIPALLQIIEEERKRRAAAAGGGTPAPGTTVGIPSGGTTGTIK